MRTAEVRVARNANPTVAYRIDVQDAPRWNAVLIDVNPLSSRQQGTPLRSLQAPNLAEAMAIAEKIKVAVLGGADPSDDT